MRRFMLLSTFLLTFVSLSAQVTNSYKDLRAKIQYVKEKFTGQQTTSDKAIAVVLRELCRNYQGRLTSLQYQELSNNLSAMKSQLKDDRWRTVLEHAIQNLHDKTDSIDIQQRILNYYSHVPQEVIYVHTDKPYYVPGDTVWFRAHLIDAVTHTPISRSHYIYIELLDNKTDTLVQRIITKCDADGVFANALTLPRHLHSGGYTLAAYTQWMRNFPAERFYYKQLIVAGESTQKSYHIREDALQLNRGCSPMTALQIVQRKEQLFIQYNQQTHLPMSCVLYGSGNLVVTDYQTGKVLRIDSQSLRPGLLNIAFVNRENGDILAEGETTIEEPKSDINIQGTIRQQGNPTEFDIRITTAEGAPLQGTYSLSVTDYDVVKPNPLQQNISEYIKHQQGDYALDNMLSGQYPSIDYSFQTSQTISGRIRGTLSKHIKKPKLMMVRPDTGLRETFELGDSSRFTINGLDFPDGTSYILQGIRHSGSTNLVHIDVDPVNYPTLHIPQGDEAEVTIPEGFSTQARKQIMYGSTDQTIELPEVIKEKKRQHKPENRSNMLPFRGLYDSSPQLNNYPTMEIMLRSLGLNVQRDTIGNLTVATMSNTRNLPLIYIDDFESDAEELLNLQPSNLKAVEYFKPGDSRLLVYRWDAPNTGLLVVTHKAGQRYSRGKSPSMASIQYQGWQPEPTFYSPQYSDLASKTRPDQRTTLYWNPRVKTDDKGHATIRFYASDISKRYLITLEGISNNGSIVHHQQVFE